MSAIIVSLVSRSRYFFFFFFNDTATTEIYTLSLHDALPIFRFVADWGFLLDPLSCVMVLVVTGDDQNRSEEHTSELQSHLNLVCRLLLEKKKKQRRTNSSIAPAMF